jgi:PAH dioxygenase small subunit
MSVAVTNIQPGGEPVAIGSEDFNRVATWLTREAYLLDRGELREWMATMSHDLDYTMPVREAVLAKDGNGFTGSLSFFSENFNSLKTRVDRLFTEQAWAEQPLSRTRHMISNIMVDRCAEGFAATSAFLITRIRSDHPYDLFTGERHDVLRREADGLKLVKRVILIDQTIIKSNNLSMFF